MKIAGLSTLDASAESLWPLIFDPRALLQLLPGCEQIEQVGPGEYRGRLTLRIPAVSGSYDTRVTVLESEEFRFCRLKGEADGAGGSVRGQASFTLIPQGAQTRIEYGGDAQITGPLAGMNPRFAEGVANTLIKQGLAKMPGLVRERAPTEAAGPPIPPRLRSLIARLRAWAARLWAQRRSWRRPPPGSR